MDESDSHFSKHDEPRISILFGITIDRSDEYENA
jgi:UDP-N-acetylmuramate-alanine ligase